MWGLVALFILIAIAVTNETVSHSQNSSSKGPDNRGQVDLAKYAIADYDSPEIADPVEREKRLKINKRYDNRQSFVRRVVHPKTEGISVFDGVAPVPAIPSTESDLIVVGLVEKVTAHLSNDKSNVYSEFTIRIDEVMKGDLKNKEGERGLIIADRTGGFVRYSDGKKVLYRINGHDLPAVGGRYLLFLNSDSESSNFNILAGYKIEDTQITPLDEVIGFGEIDSSSEQNFLQAVRNKLSGTH
jgi:hypothetical protein